MPYFACQQFQYYPEQCDLESWLYIVKTHLGSRAPETEVSFCRNHLFYYINYYWLTKGSMDSVSGWLINILTNLVIYSIMGLIFGSFLFGSLIPIDWIESLMFIYLGFLSTIMVFDILEIAFKPFSNFMIKRKWTQITGEPISKELFKQEMKQLKRWKHYE